MKCDQIFKLLMTWLHHHNGQLFPEQWRNQALLFLTCFCWSFMNWTATRFLGFPSVDCHCWKQVNNSSQKKIKIWNTMFLWNGLLLFARAVLNLKTSEEIKLDMKVYVCFLLTWSSKACKNCVCVYANGKQTMVFKWRALVKEAQNSFRVMETP